MDNSTKDLQDKIEKLQELIKTKRNENESLKIHKEIIQQHTIRYRKIFNKSYISIWEENASSVYKTMDSLPCSTGKELSKYLSSHPEITEQLIGQLEIVDINDYTVQLFEAESKAELLDLLARNKIITEDPFPAFINIFAAMMDGKPNCSHEVTTFTGKGTRLDLLMSVYLPDRENGNILVSMMDITKRKQTEDTLTHTIEQVKEQKKRTKVLQNVLLTLTSSLDKEKILNAILQEVRKIIPFSCADIRLLENEYLRVAAEVDYNKYGLGNFIKNYTVKIEEFGDVSKYIKSGEIHIIPNTHAYPGWTIFPETSFIMGYIGIPIRWDNKIIGLLSLNSDKTDTFTKVDAEKLVPFAHAAAVALQSSYLFELAKDEVRKRKETEASIKKSLSEKEILLREIHHRVKNNLSLIMSLINLQSDMLPTDKSSLIFEDLKQRVYTISLVHERLYSSKNLSSIDLESYLIDLTESVRSSSIFKEGIEFKLDIEDNLEMKADTMVPLALLINELIVNSVKYAFPKESGIISIKVSNEGNSHTIVVRDNGIGLPEDQKIPSSQLGLSLVESLASQIGGSVSFANDKGAVSTIIFPCK